ncbi:hypothetical protein F2P56_022936 [Juglans regia]|uniref:Suppressor protein SRP40-like n=2 Tax=Juglans regia TaxID=51240 RepID=A0A833UCN8_JUGRE|nr:uncharacterized protein LOC109002836 [Juglans regia]KAF5458944.1 hypothetical protein F2P56_022936 [Juglans regia]
MGTEQAANSVFGDPNLKEVGGANGDRHDNWMVVVEVGVDICDTRSIESSINSEESSSSSELIEDASSSTSYSSSSSSSLTNGPLYELSELMFHLPIKRGLSKHFQGKSQSFTSLASVKSLEDLAKRAPQRKKMKSCKSYGGGLDGHKSSTSPKAIISKKASRSGSLLSSLSRRGSLLGGRSGP